MRLLASPCSLAVIALLSACGGGEGLAPAPASPAVATSSLSTSTASATPAPSGIDLAAIDPAVRPGADFFTYANGSWLRTAVIPPDRSFFGVDARIEDTVDKQVHALLDDAAAGRLAGNERSESGQQAGDFFASFLDETTVEKAGAHPLTARLARIARIGDKRALATALGEELRADVDPLNLSIFHTRNLFGLWAEQDINDPSRVVPYLLQGGLGMPDRSYYLDASPKMAALRDRYRQHLATLLTLAGIASSDAIAARVVAFETKIAATHAAFVDANDVGKSNHPWKRADFARRAPGLDWTSFFASAGLSAQDDFITWEPGAFSGAAALVASTPLSTWKEYLTAQAIDEAAPFLAKAFADEDFAFHSTALRGVPQIPERWKRAVDATSRAVPDAVGRLYVGRHFRPESKRELQQVVEQMVIAFRARIDKLAWMTPETKAKAKAKLETLTIGIGYPDRWQEYRGLEMHRDDLLGNVERARQWHYRDALSRLGKRADPKEWAMAAQTVNAVNLPVRNALNFPAAYLQPPSYDPTSTAAVKYGWIGATIGHEISHSFDNQGALFDASGKLANWWTPADEAHFQASSAALAAQFSGYRPFADLAVDGQQTLGENIADLAGLAVAYDAWQASLGGAPAPVRDGLTGEQQFFLSYAQSWQGKARDEALRQALRSNGHAPPAYRALTVRNLDAWYPAFDVKPSDPLYLAPDARVRVW